LWIGTRTGVYYIDPDRQYFKYYDNQASIETESELLFSDEDNILLGIFKRCYLVRL
jgi:hypothetical protein